MLRRAASILLLLSWLLLGTGTLAYLHNLQHEIEDAACHASNHHHDEDNCPTHAQLHTPTPIASPVLQLTQDLPLIARTTLPEPAAPTLISNEHHSCRGPPAT